ncbi:SDR family oxidoreductase [Mesorhizobium sp. 8]|uniref:SDR family NAD(P)-dependent oxidoreductase n=1 Tax=Mesorhizobium sp. 8 TaxID=2584466 RepID=UPI0011223BC9|nr:SDR family oxidoreductase [Mesorhizobium sp. 8]QDC01690.1 SDR family oxidoreductase [Mesorhizobium sp. 8]
MAIILATGSASGIGAAALHRMVQAGDKVVVHARANRDGAETTARQLRARGADVVTVIRDLAETRAGIDLVARTVDEFGSVDTLIHAAGFPVLAQIGEVERDVVVAAFNAITFSFFDLAAAATPHLVTSGNGRIVAVSTNNAHVFRMDYPVFPVSAAAKSALETTVRSLAVQLARSGVTVNAVVPGLIRKDHGEQFLTDEEWRRYAAVIPAGRIGTPEEVGAVIAFLASREASYVTGQIIHVNGGLI